MTQTKTLAQAANEVEQHTGVKVKVGNFETFTDFMHYYRHHYRPLLEAIRDGATLDKEQRHLLDFLADDLIQAFHEEEN
ncbi:MAG: hypothetical protein PUC18_13245 [Prevotellaceae bacterium]|nr:hypothetical protein [Prevotellaceae bacterium]